MVYPGRSTISMVPWIDGLKAVKSQPTTPPLRVDLGSFMLSMNFLDGAAAKDIHTRTSEAQAMDCSEYRGPLSSCTNVGATVAGLARSQLRIQFGPLTKRRPRRLRLVMDIVLPHDLWVFS